MIQELSRELFQLRQEVKEIEERYKAELEPKKELMAAIQNSLMSQLNEQGLKSIKTDEANFSITTRKGYSIVNEAQARTWAKEHDVFTIDKRLLAQKLKDMPEVPDFFAPVEQQSLTVKAV